MNVVLTGCAGRVGSHVCAHLHAGGFEVKAVDRVFRRDLPVDVQVVNLLDREACYAVLRGAEAVVHLANHPHFNGSIPAQTLFNENVCMNMNVFQAACELGVRRIVFASSIQVFSQKHSVAGRPPDGPMFPYLPLDGRVPPRPRNPYGLSKQVSEDMLRYFADVYGVCAIAVRLPYVGDDDGVRWLRRRSGKRLGSPDEAFAYIHVSDVSRLVEACLKADLRGYRQYFAAARDEGVLDELAGVAAENYADVPLRGPGALTELIDVSELARDTGWSPRVNRLPVGPDM